MIQDLEKLMNFKSVSTDQRAVASLLDYVESRLMSRGLVTERVVHNGVNSIYAFTGSKKHVKILLQGHIDIVPGDQPFRIENGKIFGRGCFDMLFATASFLRIIDELDDLSRYDIGILLSGDEELGGTNGVGAIMKAPQYTCDVCILPDAGEGIGSMNVAAKGVLHIQLRADGTAHHGSRPWEGDGAAGKLVEFLCKLGDIFDTSSQSNSTITISQLQAGSGALNQGPSVAYAGVDIRYRDNKEYFRIKSTLKDLMRNYDIKIENEHRANNFELDTKNALVQSFIETYQSEIGRDIKFTRAHGSSDARFFDEKGIPVIMFRPDGGGAHGDSEWLSMDAWNTFHRILTQYILKEGSRSKV